MRHSIRAAGGLSIVLHDRDDRWAEAWVGFVINRRDRDAVGRRFVGNIGRVDVVDARRVGVVTTARSGIGVEDGNLEAIGAERPQGSQRICKNT